MMANVLNFYLDESGTRNPDRATTNQVNRGRDWFGMGGILIAECDEAEARLQYRNFCDKWEIARPLHSSEIRSKSKNFQWLRSLNPQEHATFLSSLERFLLGLPILGVACVIDRPGYNIRYLEKYGRKRWLLCKSAFSIVVERAVKHAESLNLKLRVMPERCSKKDDDKLREYYSDLKKTATPFDPVSSGRYSPLSAADFAKTLYEFRLKKKSSEMLQVADMYLWPMCLGGYDKSNHAYRQLIAHGKLIDCLHSGDDKRLAALGIKYYCFEKAAAVN